MTFDPRGGGGHFFDICDPHSHLGISLRKAKKWVSRKVVGLREHLLWYGLELGSDPPSTLVYHRLVVGDENVHRF